MLGFMFLYAGLFIICLYISAFIIRVVTVRGRWHRVGLFMCDHIGWHYVPCRFEDAKGGITGFDGCSMHGTCGICGETDLVEDSQGGWS